MIRLTLFAVALPISAMAQSYSSSGQNWAGSYGFPSVSERSLAIQQAQAMWSAQNPAKTEVIYNTYNDSRSNYVETNTTGEVNTDYQIGDEIGQQTYSVGSLNTGSTDIEVVGEGNSIIAENSADSSACVDGSIATVTSSVSASELFDDASVGASMLDLADAIERSAACD
ncbi:hypothetical protein [Sinisalibacter lacisalsi]|uniref:Uncharacterized protein n=1 Tax=Sinisalibacter lacisalsi TaxID=1526570 RepID=A0ABQ1QEE4_9RHOB|nr:hypothetical protein [Sinisalibacter lacisalsi]GGD24929.1 hypothetical protein GCM10011358_06740 [Sinisalibacter lacisalsi]